MSNSKSKQLQDTPTPAFVYRQYLYRKIIDMIPGTPRFLEIGCGNGTTLKYLLKKGFSGKGTEFSEKAQAYIQQNIASASKDIIIEKKDMFELDECEEYGLVVFSMVLEHIKDHQSAMLKINSLMKQNGLLMLVVPAKKSLWSRDDEEKGHYRRYDRSEILSILKEKGFNVETFWCYGFPFLNILLYVKKVLHWIKGSDENRLDKENLTKISAIDREYPPFLKFLFTESVMWPFIKIMDVFLKKNYGVGYIILAKKVRALE